MLSGALLLALAWSGCAGREPRPIEFETGSRAEVSEDGLHRVANPLFDEAWARPDVDLSRYEFVDLVLLELRYADDPTNTRVGRTTRSDFALTDSQKERFEALFVEVFTAELEASPYLLVVDRPGPGVLRAEARVVDLVVRVPTEYQSNEQVFTNSTAGMTLQLELHDSQTNTVLARMSDRRDAVGAGHGGGGTAQDLYLSNPATDTDAVRRTFGRWAQLLRRRLDELHELAAAGG